MSSLKRIVICVVMLLFFCSCEKNTSLPLESLQTDEEALITAISPITTGEVIRTEAPTEPIPAAEPVSEITIATPEKWNDFARSFNDGSVAYADYLTVTIEKTLDFKGKTFVPLYNAFNGIIKSKYTDMAFDEFFSKDDLQYRKIRPGFAFDRVGFLNITSILDVTGDDVSTYWYDIPDEKSEDPTGTHRFNLAQSLFGIRCENLTVEALTFENVDSGLLHCLFTQSADSLTVKNVRISNCHLSEGHAMLAINAMTASVTGLFMQNSKLDGYEFMSGLICWVYDDALFKDIHLYHSDFYLAPDDGGSGFWMANLSLMTGQIINGSVNFENIELFNCKAVGLDVSILCTMPNDIETCRNITAERCSLLNYSGINPFGEDYFGLLIGASGETSRNETNIIIRDCMLNSETDFETYRQKGYIIENCVAVAPVER
ncbi:MAG: hypothetical protein GX111_11955 [Clostridiales bacterium]|nr:hypothetical protein [Clostridiales bacterium]